MAIDPIHSLAPTGAPPSQVAHLGLVPDEPATERIAELSMRLETERSAGRALLAAVVELESRLNAERAEGRRSRESNAQLWSQVIDLNGALELAERPWWRRLRDHG